MTAHIEKGWAGLKAFQASIWVIQVTIRVTWSLWATIKATIWATFKLFFGNIYINLIFIFAY